MQSALQYRINPQESIGSLKLARRLPSGGRTPGTGTRGAMARGNPAATGKSRQKALGMFREQPFQYTLEPPKTGF